MGETQYDNLFQIREAVVIMSQEGQTGTPFGRQVQRERTRRGWSQRELANQSSLAVARVNRIENDPTRTITFNDAASLSRAFGIPATWLFRGAEIRDRILSAARTTEQESAEQAVDQILHVLELLDQLDSLDGPKIPDQNAVQTPMAISDTAAEWGRKTAEYFREIAGVPSGPIEDLISLIEKFGQAYVVMDALPPDVDGLSIQDPKSGYAVVAVSTNLHWERQRFTLAHELGHLLAGEMVIEAVNNQKGNKKETAAHEFARNLLIPARDLFEMDPSTTNSWNAQDAAKVAWQYRVSPQVVGIQLERARLGGRSLTKELSQVGVEVWSQIGGWSTERDSLVAKAKARRIPSELAARAINAWQDRRIPTATIGRLLNLSTQQTEQLLSEAGLARESALAE